MTKLDLVLPEELYEILRQKIVNSVAKVRYEKVIMPLAGILEGDFFNTYIKQGKPWNLACPLSTYWNLIQPPRSLLSPYNVLMAVTGIHW